MEKRVKYLIFTVVLGFVYFTFLSSEAQNRYTAIVKASSYEQLQNQYKGSEFLWQAEANFDGYDLFMVKSIDSLKLNQKSVILGESRNLGKNEMIIGEEVARKWFKSYDVVGRDYVIYGHHFKIKGVIDSRKDIVIAWQENLTNNPWKKIKIIKTYDDSTISDMVNLDNQLKLKELILFSYYNENFGRILYNLLCILLAIFCTLISKERLKKYDKRIHTITTVIIIFMMYMFLKSPVGWTQDQLFYDNGAYKLVVEQIKIGLYMLKNGVEEIYLNTITIVIFLFLINQIINIVVGIRNKSPKKAILSTKAQNSHIDSL